MMEKIYETPGFLDIFYNAKKDYIMLKWYRFEIPLVDLENAHKKTLEWAIEKKCFCYVAETSEVTGSLSREALNWWSEECVPVLQKSGLQVIVTVVPENELADLSTSQWETADFGGILVKNVMTLEEAEEFLEMLR